MTDYINSLNKYKILNETAEKNADVFFGADWLYDIPIAELTRDNGIDTTVYNRSLKGLTIKDTDKIIETCIYAIHPAKVFINIGENDITDKNFNAEEFVEKYEWLLYTIHSKCDCSIFILSVVSDRSGIVNEKLKALAEKYGCEYIDIQACRTSLVKFISKLRFFLRRHPITFCEAMRV